MTERETRTGRMALLFVLALILTAAVAPAVAQDKDENADWKQVTVLYMSDVKGKIEPCG